MLHVPVRSVTTQHAHSAGPKNNERRPSKPMPACLPACLLSARARPPILRKIIIFCRAAVPAPSR